MTQIAIVGGGPGGLFAADLLERHCGGLCDITLFESEMRLGGKVLTERFRTAPILYEAGVAELYDYSHLGPDPVRQTVEDLGLRTTPMEGDAVILDGHVVRDYRDMRRFFGAHSERALREFHLKCKELCPPLSYYETQWEKDHDHPWASKTFREVLDEIPDEWARRYVEVASRSDVATEPNLTNALYGLQNVLMDDPCYLRLYSIEGGIQRLTDGVAQRLKAAVRLECPVIRIDINPDTTYRLTSRHAGKFEQSEFDLVVIALPDYWLRRIQWGNEELRRVMQGHVAHYNNPAHYLRVTVLFQQPFWRSVLSGSYFRQEAFGGCCVYDEGTRHPAGPHGVLSWLLAGNDALVLSNHTDERLIEFALDSLPEQLAHGRAQFLEGRVHRWVGTVNGCPGGMTTHEVRRRHLPNPDVHPNLFLIGDYLFDATINGVYDSADFVAHMILTVLRRKKYCPAPVAGGSRAAVHARDNGTGPVGRAAAPGGAHTVPREYHDLYDGERPYEESWKEYFCEYYTKDLIRAIWGWSPPYTLLDCGSANGLTLEAFDRLGIEAWGIENSPYIHAKTPARWRRRNFLADVRELPFPDGSFDFAYDTCLSYLPPEDLDKAVLELYRVCRVGVFFGGVTSDMTLDVIEGYDILYTANSVFTLLEWSEIFQRAGFRLATSDRNRLGRAWRIEVESNEGSAPWYPNAGSMRYCFYSKPGASAIPRRDRRVRAAAASSV